VIVDYIDEHKERFGVEPFCAVFKDAGAKIAPSTYYAAKNRPPSARSRTDAATTTLIEKVHEDNFGVYGVRKVHAELHRQGQPVARCTVARLMRAAGLRGISRAKGPRTTVPGSGPDTRPDLVERAFAATGAEPGVGVRLRAPRGAFEPSGGERTPRPVRRSGPVKLRAVRFRGCGGERKQP
jgi:putative transposase